MLTMINVLRQRVRKIVMLSLLDVSLLHIWATVTVQLIDNTLLFLAPVLGVGGPLANDPFCF